MVEGFRLPVQAAAQAFANALWAIESARLRSSDERYTVDQDGNCVGGIRHPEGTWNEASVTRAWASPVEMVGGDFHVEWPENRPDDLSGIPGQRERHTLLPEEVVQPDT